MKKFAFAALAATTFATAPVTAGTYTPPRMDPEVIEADARSSSNPAEMVALSLTALIFLTALATGY